VFENRVLNKILGLMREGVISGWRKIRNEEILNLYSTVSIIRIIEAKRMRCSTYEMRNSY
jgi:hypothetical protein